LTYYLTVFNRLLGSSERTTRVFCFQASWYQSCIHPDMSFHIWCIVLCSSYLCPRSGNQWKLVFEVKVCQKKKHRANKEEPSNWWKLSDPDTTVDGCEILHQLIDGLGFQPSTVVPIASIGSSNSHYSLVNSNPQPWPQLDSTNGTSLFGCFIQPLEGGLDDMKAMLVACLFISIIIYTLYNIIPRFCVYKILQDSIQIPFVNCPSGPINWALAAGLRSLPFWQVLPRRPSPWACAIFRWGMGMMGEMRREWTEWTMGKNGWHRSNGEQMDKNDKTIYQIAW
jgi:hypothetical protein